MAENSIGRWVQRAFQETPWTATLIVINLVTWLLVFFKQPLLASVLAGPLTLEAAWRWLTYPLYTPMGVAWLLLFLFVFHWIGSSLERQWGSEKFLRVFVVVTLLTSAAYWVGHAVEQQSVTPAVSLVGLTLPETTLFCIWAALNSEASILLFFVLPVKARYLAIASMVIYYFSVGPVVGAFAVLVPIGGWYWARKGGSGAPGRAKQSVGEMIKQKQRERKKSKFKLVEGEGRGALTPSALKTNIPDLRELNKKVPSSGMEEGGELDRILDKIRFEGMSALTPGERETLDRQSRKLKGE